MRGVQEERVVGVFNFKGMNNVNDPSVLNDGVAAGSPYSVCVDIKNMDTLAEGFASRRTGYELATAGTFLSAFSNGVNAYVVSGGYLYSYNGVNITQMCPLTTGTFCRVNDITACSDGNRLLLLSGNSLVTNNLAYEEHCSAMIGGYLLGFFKGTLLAVNGNTIYRSTPYNILSMDDRDNIFSVFDSEIKIMLPLEDGVWVVTEKETYFVTEDSQVLVTDYGAISGTGIVTTADKARILKASGTVAIWASKQGVCGGMNSGMFVNISEDQVSYQYGENGSAILRELDGYIHYVFCPGVTEEAYNINIPVEVDLYETYQ